MAERAGVFGCEVSGHPQNYAHDCDVWECPLCVEVEDLRGRLVLYPCEAHGDEALAKKPGPRPVPPADTLSGWAGDPPRRRP